MAESAAPACLLHTMFLSRNADGWEWHTTGLRMVWFRWGCTASCGWNVRCVGVQGGAWPVLLSPCTTRRTHPLDIMHRGKHARDISREVLSYVHGTTPRVCLWCHGRHVQRGTSILHARPDLVNGSRARPWLVIIYNAHIRCYYH